MDDLLRQNLEEGGWYPGRKVDLTNHCEEMQKAQKPLPDPIRSFLEEFSGLTLKRPAPANPDYLDEVRIYLYVPTGNNDNADYEEELIGTELFYVGKHKREGSSILMDPSGRMFESVDGYVARVGDTPLQGFCELLSFTLSGVLERYDDEDEE